jgi:hypothetical protein
MPAVDIANHERLDDSVLSNRFHQLGQGIAREIFPRLQRARHNAGKINLLDFFAGLGLDTDDR